MPSAIGQTEMLVACLTGAASPPVGFSTVAQVRGLAVTYIVQPTSAPLPQSTLPAPLGSPQAAPEDSANASEGSSITTSRVSKALLADFGSCNIGQTRRLLLVVQNQTPLAASVTLWLGMFQAARPSASAQTGYATASNAALTTAGPSQFMFSQLLPNPAMQLSSNIGPSNIGAAAGTSMGSSPLDVSHTLTHQLTAARSPALDGTKTQHSRSFVPGHSATHKRKHSLVSCSPELLKLSCSTELFSSKALCIQNIPKGIYHCFAVLCHAVVHLVIVHSSFGHAVGVQGAPDTGACSNTEIASTGWTY